MFSNLFIVAIRNATTCRIRDPPPSTLAKKNLPFLFEYIIQILPGQRHQQNQYWRKKHLTFNRRNLNFTVGNGFLTFLQNIQRQLFF